MKNRENEGEKQIFTLFSFIYNDIFFIFAAMNTIKTIYHGSNMAVENPQIIVSGFYKDFGYGFYCTNIEIQAKFKYPTHQIVFCTQKALGTLKFERSIEL